jgi:hypothetical protein
MLVPLQCNLEPVVFLICIHAVPLLDPPQINHIQSQNIYYNGYVDCKERCFMELTGDRSNTSSFLQPWLDHDAG